MDLLIGVTGIGFLLGFFFLFFWLSRPSAESELLAEVTEQARTFPSEAVRPTWWTGLNADRFASPLDGFAACLVVSRTPNWSGACPWPVTGNGLTLISFLGQGFSYRLSLAWQ